MGLYQYIREQSDRQDLVGELSRWMTENPGLRPDHESVAFHLASKEFDASGEWTKRDAISRLKENEGMQRLLRIEPRLSPIISDLIRLKATKGYSRPEEYSRIKSEVSRLVGDEAQRSEVQDSESYDVLIQVISDLLPPDVVDLYSEGTPEDIELDI